MECVRIHFCASCLDVLAVILVPPLINVSAPMAKKAMPKGAIADALATAGEQKKSDVAKFLDALATLAGKEVKGNYR